MKYKGSTSIVIRPKRQITIPREFCEQLGLGPGDRLELIVQGDRLVATPRKNLAVNAVREIRETFQRYGITEKELQDAGRKARKQLVKERYGKKA